MDLQRFLNLTVSARYDKGSSLAWPGLPWCERSHDKTKEGGARSLFHRLFQLRVRKEIVIELFNIES